MLEFSVPTMTCGHCTSTITRALLAAEPSAQVVCDLPSKVVKVHSPHLSLDQCTALLEEVGFEVVPLTR